MSLYTVNNCYSDAKASGRGRKKVAGQENLGYPQQVAPQQQQRTNGFSHLNLSGLQAPFGADGKALPPSRRGGRTGKAGESGLTPSVGSIHLNGMSSDLSPGFLNSPYPYHQTPNGMSHALVFGAGGLTSTSFQPYA